MRARGLPAGLFADGPTGSVERDDGLVKGLYGGSGGGTLAQGIDLVVGFIWAWASRT
jgi:hypothetical protein